MRFRASDGFSHARSLAFVTSLLLVQGVILLVGLAASLGDTDLSATIVRVIKEAVPGPAGKSLTDAVFHAYVTGASGQNVVLVVIGVTTIVTGTTLMGQIERALNRQYGIEQDRPTLQKYGRALVLAFTAGVLSTAAFAMFALGHGIGARPPRPHDHADLERGPLAHRAGAHDGGNRAVVPLVSVPSSARMVVVGVRVDGVGAALVARDARSRVVLPSEHDVQHHLRPARGDDRDPVVVALLVDRPILFGAAMWRCSSKRCAPARRRPGDESKVEAGSRRGSPALAGTARVSEARHVGGLTMSLTDWFLTPAERGNPATEIDRRHGDGTAWTEGNDGQVLIDGADYFARLHEVLCECAAGDWVSFTDWQGDPDELLAGPGTGVGEVLAELAARGVNVRGLLWRSHPEAMNFGEAKNLAFSRAINQAGGQVLLDQRVRRTGSHHQKIVVVQHADPTRDVAFVGGIDLCHGRGDDHRHLGDPQVVELDDDHYGERPPWHDLQLELRGPAVDDLAWSFAERWRDPNPLDTRNPLPFGAAPGRRAPRRAGLTPTVAPGLSRRSARGAGPTHLPGAPAGLSLRAARRAQHRSRVPQGVLPRSPSRLPRGSVPLVARRDGGVARCARAQSRPTDRGRDPALPRSRRRDLRRGEPHRSRARARRAARRRSRARRGLRRREPRGNSHLRALQGVHRR